MRLQLRQRFASATSKGMSPIEFSRKLLRLWGGTLEQVYETKSAITTSVNASTSTSDNTKGNTSDNTNTIENTLVLKPNILKRVVSTSLEKSNNCSSLELGRLFSETKQAPRSKIEQEVPALGDGLNAGIESIPLESSIGEHEPRIIQFDGHIGKSTMNENGLHQEGPFNLNFDPQSVSSTTLPEPNLRTGLKMSGCWVLFTH